MLTALPDPTVRPAISIVEAARLLGISRGLAYEAVRTGELPSVRIGRRILIPTARLGALLGVVRDDVAARTGEA